MTGAPDLFDRQEAFLRAILDENAPLPGAWTNRQTAGLAVYRGNYRHAVMGALNNIYERTARFLGEKTFRQLGINHVIKHPPTGWSIDDVGAGFADTCARYAANNPAAAQLAWLEWTMRTLATAPDSQPMTAGDFTDAIAGFGDEEWGALRLQFQPLSAARLVDFDLAALWKSLADDAPGTGGAPCAGPAQTCLVWREGERPTFILAGAQHAAAFCVMQAGGCYGDMIAAGIGDDPDPAPEAIEAAAMDAGATLGHWLQHGIVTGINP